jgi:hypothetical protein
MFLRRPPTWIMGSHYAAKRTVFKKSTWAHVITHQGTLCLHWSSHDFLAWRPTAIIITSKVWGCQKIPSRLNTIGISFFFIMNLCNYWGEWRRFSAALKINKNAGRKQQHVSYWVEALFWRQIFFIPNNFYCRLLYDFFREILVSVYV